MNRRGFLGAILKAGVGAMILPPALKYARTWKRTASGLVLPTGMYSRDLLLMSAMDVERFIRDDMFREICLAWDKADEAILNGTKPHSEAMASQELVSDYTVRTLECSPQLAFSQP